MGSDSSVTMHISPIDAPMASVMQLEGIRFSYSYDMENDSDPQYRLGLVAQDVERVVPEAVKEMEDHLKAVAYSDMVPLLIEAMKEQQLQIDSLQVSLMEQEEQINRIKNRRWFKKKTFEQK